MEGMSRKEWTDPELLAGVWRVWSIQAEQVGEAACGVSFDSSTTYLQRCHHLEEGKVTNSLWWRIIGLMSGFRTGSSDRTSVPSCSSAFRFRWSVYRHVSLARDTEAEAAVLVSHTDLYPLQ
jgi:hypothetical protein